MEDGEQGRSWSFASFMQALLVGLLLLSFLLIAQQYWEWGYRIGIGLLIVSTFVEIAFGNIPAEAGFWTSMRIFVLTMVIVVIVFSAGIYLAPYLVSMGR